MSGTDPQELLILRGDPTPEELAALLVVLAAMRATEPPPEPYSPDDRWSGAGNWRQTVPTGALLQAAGWDRNARPARRTASAGTASTTHRRDH